MDTIEHLRSLFVYNDWANRRFITTLKESPVENAQKILAHLLTTEAEYYRRLFGKDSFGFDFWPPLSLEQCGALARDNAQRYEKLLRGFDDEGLSQKVSYRTSEGVPYDNSFRELFTHVLMHSAIHRGNIVPIMRQSGFQPPLADYIIYLRETGA
jgi:uncharacterized damage-inducible protein DinB